MLRPLLESHYRRSAVFDHASAGKPRERVPMITERSKASRSLAVRSPLSGTDSCVNRPTKYTASGARGLFGHGIGQHELHHSGAQTAQGNRPGQAPAPPREEYGCSTSGTRHGLAPKNGPNKRDQSCGRMPGQITGAIGRSERIRTSGPCVPNTVLYQAELHSEADLGVCAAIAGGGKGRKRVGELGAARSSGVSKRCFLPI